MSNDKSDFTTLLDEKIIVDDFLQRWHWAGRLGVTEDRLREVVKEVGPMVDDVRKRLGSEDSPAALANGLF